MRIEFAHSGHAYTITTEHATASYGRPVLLVDGQVVDGQVWYEPDAEPHRSALDLAADAAGVHDGPMTRRDLASLGKEMAGSSHQAIIAEFQRRGRKLAAAEMGAAGGRARSQAKATTARENGRKGGRPRKSCEICG